MNKELIERIALEVAKATPRDMHEEDWIKWFAVEVSRRIDAEQEPVSPATKSLAFLNATINTYSTPQPCPKCAELEKERDAAWSINPTVSERLLQSNVAKQSAEIERLTKERDNYFAITVDLNQAILQQTLRIAEIEAYNKAAWATADRHMTERSEARVRVEERAVLIEQCESVVAELIGVSPLNGRALTLDEALEWGEVVSGDDDLAPCDKALPILAAEVRRLQLKLTDFEIALRLASNINPYGSFENLKAKCAAQDVINKYHE